MNIPDKRVILTQYLVYIDSIQSKIFIHKNYGKLLAEIRGTSHYSSHPVIALSQDNGLSLAEIDNKNLSFTSRDPATIWHKFAKWYNNQST